MLILYEREVTDMGYNNYNNNNYENRNEKYLIDSMLFYALKQFA